MVLGNIMEYFPRIIPKDTIQIVDEAHEFVVLKYEDGTSSTKYKYKIDKAPIESVEKITGYVNGSEYTFEKNVDYEVIDNDGDNKLDTVDWSIGGKQPDDNTEFYITYTAEPIIERYIEAHEETTNDVDKKIEEVIDSRQINNATGDDLDRIGSLFGDLGKRRGRTDNEYRIFLKSIVRSFGGRGTLPGLKFAISAGINTNPENIEIIEDFNKVGYKIRINNVDTSIISSVINDLAELADPSGVELLAPPVIVLEGSNIYIDRTESNVVSTQTGLGGDTLTMDGSSKLT